MDSLDIVGQKFHQLLVLEFFERVPRKDNKSNKYFYICKCDCGEETKVERSYLKTGHTKSCGCLKKITGKNNKCWSGHGDISGRLWGSIKSKAESRNLTFDITIQDAWKQFQKQKGLCALTGEPINLKNSKNNYSKRSASLDRIDNNKGYLKNNIQWLHKDINWMKGKFSTDRFIELCNKVSNHI